MFPTERNCVPFNVNPQGDKIGEGEVNPVLAVKVFRKHLLVHSEVFGEQPPGLRGETCYSLKESRKIWQNFKL